MAWQAPLEQTRRFQLTALLQALPVYLEELTTPQEVVAVISVLESLLAGPTAEEKVYLGAALQATFSLHLLGYSPELVEIRERQLAKTAFLLDSNVVLPTLARSSPGYEAATQLVAALMEAECMVATTATFGKEVADHGRWAVRHVERAGSALATEILEAATGRAGFRENLFLCGFLEELAAPGGTNDFAAYLDSACGNDQAHRGFESAFVDAISERDIPVVEFGAWEGFVDTLFHDRDALSEQIESLRRARNNYRGERQVKAEAEARIIVERLRTQDFGLAGRTVEQAHFVSNSRVVDRVDSGGVRITIRPEAVQQWISTVRGADDAQLSSLIDGMLGELAESNLAVLDEAKLARVFAPLVTAAAEQLDAEVKNYGALSALEYGEPATMAYRDQLALPIVMKSALLQRVRMAEEERDREKLARESAEQSKELTDKERATLDRLQSEKDAKRRRQETKRRAAESRPKRKKRGRG
jgi:hypothetical protein